MLGTFEATRFATGRKNALRVEVSGSKGALSFDLEDLNSLQFYDATAPATEQGFTKILVTEPQHPYIAAWWPAGHMLGYEHGFSHQVMDFVEAIAAGSSRRRPSPTACTCSACWAPSSPARRRQRLDRRLTCQHARRALITEGHPWHAPSPCSPASGPTCRSKRSRSSPPDGATTASRSPAGATTSTRGAGTRTGYVEGKLELLAKYGLKVWAISNHLKGQAVCDDPIDQRHRDILSAKVWGDGDPEGVRQRAAEEMKHTARLAAKLGVKTVIGFTGSSIWKYVAMFPPASQAMIDAGYQDFADRWNPILDVFDEVGVRFAHEVHPSEIAYDYWTTVRTLEAIGHREAFGLNWDPSHMVWQDIDSGRRSSGTSRTGSTTWTARTRRCATATAATGGSARTSPWADRDRGWDFISTGHGDVPWEAAFRMLNQIGYDGPISVEWEDAGMDRLVGAPEALEFVRRLAFDAPSAAFDAAFSSKD